MTWQSLLIVYTVSLFRFVHEVKLLYVRYDALMNATDVWEDMNMICRYIDKAHTYTIGCGLHNYEYIHTPL